MIFFCLYGEIDLTPYNLFLDDGVIEQESGIEKFRYRFTELD